MTRAPSQQRRLPAGLSGLLLALVALAMQLAMAAAVPFPAPVAGVDRMIAGSICHSDAAGEIDHGNAPAPHHAPDCAVCPLCQAVAHAGALLAMPMAAFVSPVLLVAHAFARPAPRAPPGVAVATSARGPPLPL